MSRLLLAAFLSLALLVPSSAFATTVGGEATPSCCYAFAAVSNPTPIQNSTETLTARLVDSAGVGVAGAMLHSAWHYKTTTPSCDAGPTGARGFAQCARSISRATLGYTVVIDVAFSAGGASYTTSTSFTPQ